MERKCEGCNEWYEQINGKRVFSDGSDECGCYYPLPNCPVCGAKEAVSTDGYHDVNLQCSECGKVFKVGSECLRMLQLIAEKLGIDYLVKGKE